MSHNDWRAKSLRESFSFALAGLRYVIRTQRNARVHLLIAAAVVVLGLFLGVSAVEWAILALAMGLVLAGEMGNTVVETVVDLASPEFHELARVAKDVAASTVLVTALTAVAVGLFILGPPLWDRLASL